MVDRAHPKIRDYLEQLRGCPNPFQEAVQPREAYDFQAMHTDAINRKPYEHLCDAIAGYRLDEGFKRQPVAMRSGVVIVDGMRGSGKTHLLHSLRQDCPHALIVAPLAFNEERDFIEQLLGYLNQSLTSAFDEGTDSALWKLAQWFSRRVLAEAIGAMTPFDWLAHTTPHGLARIVRDMVLPRLSRAADQEPKRQAFLRLLSQEDDRPIADVSRDGPGVDAALAIAAHHVQRTERGFSVGATLRSHLYQRLVGFAFTEDPNALFSFLTEGYANLPFHGTPSRSDLSSELFGALTTLFRLYGRPVCIAFDAMEATIGIRPKDKAEPFFTGLAAAVDAPFAVPIVLFFEGGLLSTLQSYMPEYASHRLEQGIPFRRSAPLTQLRVGLGSLDEVRALVAARMRPNLRIALGTQDVPPDMKHCPFTEQQMDWSARGGETELFPLRQVIRRLDEKYREIVFGHDQQLNAGSAAELADLSSLHPLWHRWVDAAARDIQSRSLSNLIDKVYAGAERWLRHLAGTWHQLADGASIDAGAVAGATNRSHDAHAVYGRHVALTFGATGGASEAALTFLLGRRNGMPVDLHTKLKLVADGELTTLRIVWPRDPATDADPVRRLPNATRAVWDEFAPGLGARVDLQLVTPTALAPLLACVDFADNVLEIAQGLTRSDVDRFVFEQTKALHWVAAPIGKAAPMPQESTA